MIKVFDCVSEPAILLDDEVDGLGAAVAVEVGQDLGLPGPACGTAGRLRESGRYGSCRHLERDLAAFGRHCVMDGAQLFLALPGKINFPDRVAGVQRCA
jgi:hypothetical protein